MPSTSRSKRHASAKSSRRTVPEKVHSAAEVADALGVSKMTVLRYIDDGSLPAPNLYLQYQGHRVWLWNTREVRLAVDLLRERKRAKQRR
jgi:hypothetical protein